MRALRLAPLPFFVAGCFIKPPPAILVPPVDRRLVLGDPGGPQVILEADWRVEGGRFCVSRAPVDVITPAGPIRMFDADLCATQRPPALSGEAAVPLPGIGILASLVSGGAPRGRISLARGAELGALAIGNQRLPVEPSFFYISVEDAGQGHDLLLGHATLSTGAAPRLVIEPHGPVFYVAGNLAGLLPAPLAGVALGISPNGALPWTSAQELYDGRSSAVRRVAGHLLVQGTFPLGGLPLQLTGRVVADLDADDDGLTTLGGDAQDLALGGEVSVRAGYAHGALRLDVEVGAASLFMDRDGAVYFAGSVPPTLFARTSLSGFEPAGPLALRAVYRSAGDFAVQLRGDGRLLGLPFGAAEVELASTSLRLRGRLDVPQVGPVDVAGAVATDGSWAVAGRVASVTLGGVPLSDVEITASPRGVTVSGANTSFLGRPFRVSGAVSPDGQVAVAGTLALTSSSRVQLIVDARGARAAFEGRVCVGRVCVDVPPTEIDQQGNVCASYPLIGRQCVKVM